MVLLNNTSMYQSVGYYNCWSCFFLSYLDVSLSITSSGETVVGSMLILTCKYSGALVNNLLLRWTSPNGDIISNTTDFSQLEDGRVASSLPLQIDSLVISDAGQYTCDAVTQTGMSTIETSSRIYSLILKG